MFDFFQPTPESYAGEPLALTMTRILQAFDAVFGLAPGRVSTKFKDQLQSCVDKNYPALRCSTARAILEGRIPGIEAPVSLQREQKHLRQALFLLDALETMAAAYVESVIAEKGKDFTEEIKVLKSTMGTAKVPGILSIFDNTQSEPESLPKQPKGKMKKSA